MTLSVLLFFFSFFTDDDLCGRFPNRDFDAPDKPKHTTSYSNSTYGFSVAIPRGLTGHSTPPPASQHGFGIVLSWEPRAYIYFDGSYNAMDAKNVAEIQELQLKWTAEKAVQVLKVEKYRGRLGPLKAIRFQARYTCKKLEGIFIEDTTIALHRGIIYTATLLTTAERYKKDRVVLERMMEDWKPLHRY